MTRKEYDQKFNYKKAPTCLTCKHGSQLWRDMACQKMKEYGVKANACIYSSVCDNWEEIK